MTLTQGILVIVAFVCAIGAIFTNSLRSRDVLVLTSFLCLIAVAVI